MRAPICHGDKVIEMNSHVPQITLGLNKKWEMLEEYLCP